MQLLMDMQTVIPGLRASAPERLPFAPALDTARRRIDAIAARLRRGENR